MTECPHGVSLDVTTKDGWPLCAICRRLAKARAPADPPKITPPRFDIALLLED